MNYSVCASAAGKLNCIKLEAESIIMLLMMFSSNCPSITLQQMSQKKKNRLVLCNNSIFFSWFKLKSY